MSMIEALLRKAGNFFHIMSNKMYDIADALDFSKDEHEDIERNV